MKYFDKYDLQTRIQLLLTSVGSVGLRVPISSRNGD